MFILDTHIHRLIFRIDSNNPIYIARWSKCKKDCENGDNEKIIEKMKIYCKMESNKTIAYLQRAEGGIGGDSNITNKQARFRRCWNGLQSDNDIVLDQVTNADNHTIDIFSLNKVNERFC